MRRRHRAVSARSRRSRPQASRAHRVNSHNENRKLQLSENSAHRGSYQHWRVYRGSEHVHFPTLAAVNAIACRAHACTQAYQCPGGPGECPAKLQANQCEHACPKRKWQGAPTPQSSLPPNPLYLPAYPPATYPRPKETLCSRPATSSNRQLHSLSCFTTVHPSSELALSFSRLTMGRSPSEAVDEQDDTALDPH